MGYACSLSGLHAGSKTQMLSILRSSYLKVVPLCIPTKHSHIYDLAMGRGQSGRMHNFYTTSNPLVFSSTLLSLLSLDAFIYWCGNEGEDGGKAEKNGCCLFPASFIFFLSCTKIIPSEAKKFGVLAPCFYRKLLRVQINDVCEDLCTGTCPLIPHVFANIAYASEESVPVGNMPSSYPKRRSFVFSKEVFGD